jgi:plastocyanin
LIALQVAAAAAAPRTVVVRLEGNAFRPDQIHARVGDTLRFVNGNGGPHNVKFEADSIAPAARALIEKAFGGEKIGPMSGPLLLDPGETYAIVVPALPVGRYPLYCSPHWANMRGKLIVDP